MMMHTAHPLSCYNFNTSFLLQYYHLFAVTMLSLLLCYLFIVEMGDMMMMHTAQMHQMMMSKMMMNQMNASDHDYNCHGGSHKQGCHGDCHGSCNGGSCHGGSCHGDCHGDCHGGCHGGCHGDYHGYDCHCVCFFTTICGYILICVKNNVFLSTFSYEKSKWQPNIKHFGHSVSVVIGINLRGNCHSKVSENTRT